MNYKIYNSFYNTIEKLIDWIEQHRWSDLYNKNSWTSFTERFEKQAVEFYKPFGELMDIQSQLAHELKKDFDQIFELTKEIDRKLENWVDLQNWPTICQSKYLNNPPCIIEDDVERVMNELELFQDKLNNLPMEWGDKNAKPNEQKTKRATISKLNDEIVMSPTELAEYFDIPQKSRGAFRKQLERLKRSNTDCFVENAQRKPNEAKYLYKIKDARPIAEKIRNKHFQK